jgi:hypothetical protein
MTFTMIPKSYDIVYDIIWRKVPDGGPEHPSNPHHYGEQALNFPGMDTPELWMGELHLDATLT